MKQTVSTIYTAIERDKRGYWHPVIELRERGTITWSVVSVDGVLNAHRARRAADKVARRLVRENA